MKATIQIYGLIIVFMVMVIIIPSLLNYAICYQRCSTICNQLIDVIEVNEGILKTNDVEEIVIKTKQKYHDYLISINPEQVTNTHSRFHVCVKKNVSILSDKINFLISCKRVTKIIW